MAKKEIIKVAFSEERLKLAMAYMGHTYKTLAAASGVSDTTIRRAAKKGEINEELLYKIAVQLCTTKQFLSGDKSCNALARAFKTVLAFVEGAPAALEAEFAVSVAE